MDIRKEEAHDLELALLIEEYSSKIEENVDYANNKTAEKLETEKARTISDGQQTPNLLRKEKLGSSNNPKKERAGQTAMTDLDHQR